MRERVQKILHKIQDLPTLPAVYKRVNELVRSPNSSASDIGAVVGEDQVITAKLLRLVNSAHYGFPEKVETVSRAVSLVGQKALVNLILATSVIEIFQEDESIEGFQVNEFWKHSLGVATISRCIARRRGLGGEEEFFVGGLLHDIGKIVWIQYFADELRRVLRQVRETKGGMLECENQVMGLNHTRVGRMLAKRWGLPDRYIESIAWHHDPRLAENHPDFVSVVHVADSLACALELGQSGSFKVPWIQEEAWERCGLAVDDLDGLFAEIDEAYRDSLMILSFWNEREMETVEQALADL